MKIFRSAVISAAVFVGLAAVVQAAGATVLRVGYFPNITHAQGVIGSDSTLAGRGWFEQRLDEGVTVQWCPFNAGPSAVEAILAGSVDLTYVGPNPALNAYIRSRGAEIRVLAGAALGGGPRSSSARTVASPPPPISRAASSLRHSSATPRMWPRARG